jgi:hypothetical protein
VNTSFLQISEHFSGLPHRLAMRHVSFAQVKRNWWRKDEQRG